MSVYFPPRVQRALDKPVELKITASTRQLLQDVADRHVHRPGWARICEDINRRIWQRVDIRIARLHAAGLVDLAGCPGNWFLTDAGRALLAAHCRSEGDAS